MYNNTCTLAYTYPGNILALIHAERRGCRSHWSLFPVGHYLPAHKVLRNWISLSLRRLRDRSWKRRPGHPRGRSIDQVTASHPPTNGNRPLTAVTVEERRNGLQTMQLPDLTWNKNQSTSSCSGNIEWVLLWHCSWCCLRYLISLQNEVLPDRFVVCGESYKDLRELLAQIVIGKDVTALTEKVQVNFLWLFSLLPLNKL